jgi:hypothetical protein
VSIMGRYCDVYGQQVKLTGLLREVVLDLAADAKHHHDLGFDGVYVEYDDSDEPLSHLQDIYRYQGDVNAFARWRKSRSIQTVRAAATPGQVLVSRPNQTGGSLSSSPLAQCADDPRLRPYVKAWS